MQRSAPALEGVRAEVPAGLPAGLADTVADDAADTFPADARSGAWGHDPHWHPFGLFLTAVTGSGELTVDGRALPFDVRSGVWVPAGVEHAGRFADDLVHLGISLTEAVPAGGARSVAVDTDLRSALLAWSRDDDPMRELSCQRAVRAAVDRSPLARPVLPVPTGPLTAPVHAALRRDPADRVPLEQWAQRLFTSPASIRRAFLAETGMTFSDWTTAFRIERSIPRLRAGATVAAVARAHGFSPNGYTLACRRWTGRTPSSLRP